VGRNSVSTAVFCRHFGAIKLFDMHEWPFILRKYFTREEVKVMQSRHYTTCEMCLEKIKLSDTGRLFSEHIWYTFCVENSTIQVEIRSGPDILSCSITVTLNVMATGRHICCTFCCCRRRRCCFFVSMLCIVLPNALSNSTKIGMRQDSSIYSSLFCWKQSDEKQVCDTFPE
jgi:hypothetical protein